MTLMYLEDYLELISFLPQEFKERLTKVRELDLEASNRRDNIEKLKQQLKLKTPSTATDGSSSPAATDKAIVIAEINSEYDKIIQLGVEKVKIVTGLEEMMLRYNRRLTADTEKFKLELEADNPGITETLEQRAEQDMRAYRESMASKFALDTARRRHGDIASHRKPLQAVLPRISVSSSAAIDAQQGPRKSMGAPTGPAGVMLEKAASQALAATGHMQQGRRTAGMKASLEAIRNGSRDQSTDRAAQSTAPRSERKRAGRRKADTTNAETGEGGDDDERYCFCKQPSFGFMVACDNPGCPIEWFHGACVGLQESAQVEGIKWYCLPCKEIRDQKRQERAKMSGMTGNRLPDVTAKFARKSVRKGH